MNGIGVIFSGAMPLLLYAPGVYAQGKDAAPARALGAIGKSLLHYDRGAFVRHEKRGG